ncbi:GntR family transcriptional regulator [Peribacillus butanolivorans]|uniref:GntR family transcriptional regulator n=1 Tax=Peribacillus butanolivorans TaxID=421767 RepID=UPI003660C96E
MKKEFKTASEELYTSIKERIINGDYFPGVHLVEADLLREFSYSRPTIREALHRLANDGIVELIPHRGARVRKLTTKEIIDLYQVMEYLGGLTAKLVAEFRDLTLIKNLEKILEEDAKAVVNGNFKLHANLILEFQILLVRFTENQELINTVERAQLLTSMHYVQIPLKRRMEEALQNHRKMLDAISAHDGDLAEDIMRKHFREGLKLVRQDL